MIQYMNLIGQKARKASLKKINTKTKNKVLKKYALLLNKEQNSILKANAKDLKLALKKGLKNNLIDRLSIDQIKLNNIKNSINKIIKLKDPVDNVLEKWSRPNGLKINKVSIPIGVIGVIDMDSLSLSLMPLGRDLFWRLKKRRMRRARPAVSGITAN